MWWDSWNSLGRIVLLAVSTYAVLVLLLRLSGKRTLAKLNAFDLVVTVALGSTLSSTLLPADVALSEGVVALSALVAVQYTVARLSIGSALLRRVVKSEPTIVVLDGLFRPRAMAQMRVTEGEIRQAVRSSGHGGLDLIAMVVLESDGTLSVIARSSVGDGRAIDELRIPGP